MKIKTLRDILEPKAINLGISFEELLTDPEVDLTEDKKFGYLKEELFKRPTLKGISYAFNKRLFKKLCKKYYIEYNDKTLQMYNQASNDYLIAFNEQVKPMNEFIFMGVKIQSRWDKNEKSKVQWRGTVCYPDSPAWKNEKNVSSNIDNQFPNKWIALSNAISNGANLDKHLTVIDKSNFEEYTSIFSKHYNGFPDGYYCYNAIQNLIDSFLLRTKQFENKQYFSNTFKKSRDRFEESINEKLRRNFTSISDLSEYVDYLEKSYSKWAEDNQYDFDNTKILDIRNKGMVVVGAATYKKVAK